MTVPQARALPRRKHRSAAFGQRLGGAGVPFGHVAGCRGRRDRQVGPWAAPRRGHEGDDDVSQSWVGL